MGCSAENSETSIQKIDFPALSELPEAAAQIDAESMQIFFPIDQYGMSLEDERTVDRANRTVLDACMKKKGLSDPYLEAAKSDSASMPSWRYGYWNADYVAQYGPEGNTPAPIEIEDEQVSAELMKCQFSVDSIEILDSKTFQSDEESPNALLEGSSASYEKTLNSTEAKEIIEIWQKCVVDKGYQLDPSAHDGLQILNDESLSDEALRKSFATAAECSDRNLTVQKLSNIEARYQAYFIEENQAIFNELQETAKERVAAAQKILLEG
ncbi:hypothetical protein GCM10022198_01980 [Klugiella xanthotipulae]